MENKKKKGTKKALIIGGIVVVAAIVLWMLRGAIVMGLLVLSSVTAKVEVNTDIAKYQDYIGENALPDYALKWGMSEVIFPEEITEDMNVQDYKMVYYNPFDAQYLSYLVVEYDEASYEEELARLKAYPRMDYIGYYGAQGFDEKYELVAMMSDSYQGFVYALTDNEGTIIYVEIIFCNYFMDLDYKKYISQEYLPIGFDATSDNPYMQEKMKNRP